MAIRVLLLSLCCLGALGDTHNSSGPFSLRLEGGASRCEGEGQLQRPGLDWTPLGSFYFYSYSLEFVSRLCSELDCGSALSVTTERVPRPRESVGVKEDCVQRELSDCFMNETYKSVTDKSLKINCSGKLQYRAFLLFKALQMTRRAFSPPRAQRSTRADPNAPSICQLKPLTVSLERYLISPNTANIWNCRGVCTFPMALTRNHAVLLNSHIESGHSSERAPCCVPVAYDKMEVVYLGEQGTSLKIEPDMVATACECR